MTDHGWRLWLQRERERRRWDEAARLGFASPDEQLRCLLAAALAAFGDLYSRPRVIGIDPTYNHGKPYTIDPGHYVGWPDRKLTVYEIYDPAADAMVRVVREDPRICPQVLAMREKLQRG